MKNPNAKERRFLKAYLEGQPLAECAKYAGSKAKDNESLKVIGHRMLTNINLSMEEILDQAGLTDSYIAQKLLEGLQAQRPAYGIFRGQFIDERWYDDHSARAKYLEMLCRMKGKFIDRHELTGKEGGDIELVIKAEKRGEPKKIDID